MNLRTKERTCPTPGSMGEIGVSIAQQRRIFGDENDLRFNLVGCCK